MRTALHNALALALAVAAFSVDAADDRFDKEKGPMRGFLAATDPLYVKECGACHFPYSPGLLPARSWELHLKRLDKHFGENVALNGETREALRRYLAENAADVSKYEGSHAFMERIEPSQTPYRLQEVLLYRTMHRIILEVINLKPKVKVRKLTNCNACHQGADNGSFANSELLIPGLTPTGR